MKTTIELAEDLVLEAKKVALQRRTTLRDLVDRGLRREIGWPREDERHPLMSLMAVDAGVWRGVEGDAYVAEQRAGW